MKQLKGNNIKVGIVAISALIILAGIIVINIFGFNKELKYQQTQCIDVYIENQIDKTKIDAIVDDVLGKDNIVQTVEIYEDMVTIRAKEITEEQKNNIVNKIKENYEFTQTAEETEVTTVPATRIRDMYKHYVLPFAISGILVLAYMLIRYYKKGMVKVLARTILIPVIAQLILISVIAIARIPVGIFTPILVISTYVISLLFVIKQNEK